MKIAELIAELSKLPPNAEVAVLAASAIARPPVLVRVQPLAWRDGYGGRPSLGLRNPANAFLIRPANETIGGSEDLREPAAE